MSEEVAKSDDRRPRNFRMLRLHFTGHAIRGLAHNEECPLQCGPGHPSRVTEQGLRRAAARERHDTPAIFLHVEQGSARVMVFARHR